MTDHNPNMFFEEKKVLSMRQGRWAEKLSRFKFTWEYRPGRLSVADPLSRIPIAARQMISFALGIACTSKTDDESDILSDIKAGYAADAYFADGKHTRNFMHKDDVYHKYCAVFVADVRAVKVRILKDLHDSAYACHVV